MSVHWEPSPKAVPIADYRFYSVWQESNRYREILKARDRDKSDRYFDDFGGCTSNGWYKDHIYTYDVTSSVWFDTT